MTSCRVAWDPQLTDTSKNRRPPQRTTSDDALCAVQRHDSHGHISVHIDCAVYTTHRLPHRPDTHFGSPLSTQGAGTGAVGRQRPGRPDVRRDGPADEPTRDALGGRGARLPGDPQPGLLRPLRPEAGRHAGAVRVPAVRDEHSEVRGRKFIALVQR